VIEKPNFSPAPVSIPFIAERFKIILVFVVGVGAVRHVAFGGMVVLEVVVPEFVRGIGAVLAF